MREHQVKAEIEILYKVDWQADGKHPLVQYLEEEIGNRINK